MKNPLRDHLLQVFGDKTFSRNDVIFEALKINVSRKDIQLFLLDPKNKIKHGVYKVFVPKDTVTDKSVIKERINEQFNSLQELVQGVCNNNINALIVSGPPGLGKTFTVTNTLDSNQVQYKLLVGNSSPSGLYRSLYECKDRNQVLVIDDCDSVFSDMKSLNILKAACDSGKEKKICWASEYFKESDIPTEFIFSGSIIFITNVDFEQSVAKQTKLSIHLEALMSRAIYFDLKINTTEQFLIRIEEVLKRKHSEMISNMVVRYLRDNVDYVRELSIRTALKVISLMKTTDDWEKLSNLTILNRQ